MVQSWLLRAEFEVPQPIERVFPFFADAANLEAITPPWLRFRIATPTPIVMATGTVIDYQLRVHGIPVRWRSRIAVWDPPHRFVDEQLRGPYRRWYHTHTFEPTDRGTRLRDEVEMRVPGGPLAGLVFAWFVRRDVRTIFEHRTRTIAARFGGDPATAQIAIEPIR